MISCPVQWSTQPDIEVFHLRGRLLNSGEPTYFATVAARTSVASMHLVLEDPGERAVEHDARGVAARLRRPEADGLQAVPDRRDVLDADPVQLHVLPVGDVGDVPAEVGADPADGPELVAGQPPAVDADAEHEVGVLELLGLQQGGLAAGDALRPLGVEAHPAHPAAEVAGVDAVEAGLRVDVEDPLTDLEAVGVLLHPLVGVERLAVAERPLALAHAGDGCWCGWGWSRRYFFLRSPPTRRPAGRVGR